MDIELHYTCVGEGPVLILLHGNGEDSSFFESQIEEFSQDFCVCAIDTRGHGMSPRGEAPFTLFQFAEDLLNWIYQPQVNENGDKTYAVLIDHETYPFNGRDPYIFFDGLLLGRTGCSSSEACYDVLDWYSMPGEKRERDGVTV